MDSLCRWHKGRRPEAPRPSAYMFISIFAFIFGAGLFSTFCSFIFTTGLEDRGGVKKSQSLFAYSYVYTGSHVQCIRGIAHAVPSVPWGRMNSSTSFWAKSGLKSELFGPDKCDYWFPEPGGTLQLRAPDLRPRPCWPWALCLRLLCSGRERIGGQLAGGHFLAHFKSIRATGLRHICPRVNARVVFC